MEIVSFAMSKERDAILQVRRAQQVDYRKLVFKSFKRIAQAGEKGEIDSMIEVLERSRVISPPTHTSTMQEALETFIYWSVTWLKCVKIV